MVLKSCFWLDVVFRNVCIFCLQRWVMFQISCKLKLNSDVSADVSGFFFHILIPCPQVLQKLGKADETKDEQFEQVVINFRRQEVREHFSSAPSLSIAIRVLCRCGTTF